MKLIRLAIVALVGAGSLQGEPPRGGGEEGPQKRGGPKGERSFKNFFDSADANGDGVVSVLEFAALDRISKIPEEKRQGLFKRFDKNGDGLIQRAEMKPPQRPEGRRPFPMLHELDANKDGVVSYEEFVAGPYAQRIPKDRLRPFFERLDTNGDGSLSHLDKPPGRGGPERRPPPHHDRQKMIESLDKDGDNALSFEEFRQAPWIKERSEDEQEDQFEELDTNDDLVIDKSDKPRSGSDKPRGGPEKKGPRKEGSRGPREPENKIENP
jgi:Ca2+-binding EF-hand superfamily protein